MTYKEYLKLCHWAKAEPMTEAEYNREADKVRTVKGKVKPSPEQADEDFNRPRQFGQGFFQDNV